MIKLSKKSLLLFVVAAASMASASSASAVTFDGAGQHTLTSSNLGFNAPLLMGGAGCTSSTFEVNVPAGGATATVTTASFSGCTGNGSLAGFTADVTPTNFPWEITATGVAGRITIEGIHITNTFTVGGPTVTLEGSLTGTFDNTTHTATFSTAGDLTATSTQGNVPATVSGTLRDDQQTLGVT